MRITEEEFCKIESMLSGEEIDNIKQLTYKAFTSGNELLEYLNDFIELAKDYKQAQKQHLNKHGVSGSFNYKCDDACYYHCTRNGQQLPDCCKDDKLYSENDLVDSAKYGYEYHSTTSFPDKSFEDNCKNNFLQHLFVKFGKNYH